MKRSQFNVRIRRDVAELLRVEAERRGIGPGLLLEELATNYRSETRPGLWLELEPGVEAGLRAVAAATERSPEELLNRLIGSSIRAMLEELVEDLLTADDLLEQTVRLENDPPLPQRVDDAAFLPRGERRSRPRRATLDDHQREALTGAPAELPRSGDALRRWREELGLSKGELGRACGVSSVAIGLWENKGELPAPILLKLLPGYRSLV